MANKKKKSRAQTAIQPQHNETRTLWCLIEGDSTPFSVTAPDSASIDGVKKLIYETRKGDFRNIGPGNLVLWKLNGTVPLEPEEELSGRIQSLYTALEQAGPSDKLQRLGASKRLRDVFPQTPSEGNVHILVQPPSGHPQLKRARLEQTATDISGDLVERWTTPILSLPPLQDLADYVGGPLEDDKKIPLAGDLMRALMIPFDLKSNCTADDLNRLFRSSEDEEAKFIWPSVAHALARSPPDSASTESAFILFWDLNIRELLDIALDGKSIRDSNEHASTALLRPDFGFLTGEICTFRGEEKATRYTGSHPKTELIDKLTWTYNPAPYILGYYAIGVLVTLVAISPTNVVDLVVIDLSRKRDRIRNLVHVVKLCSIIAALRDVIGGRRTAELVPIHQDATGTIIKVGSSAVEKKYTREDGSDRVKHLQYIYDLLRTKSVPNVDFLVQCYINDKSHGSVVYLQPKGIDTVPRRVSEVLEAIKCVLDALAFMHAEPHPVFHRDIRWPNIIQSGHTQSRWFLIDWDDAATPPTVAATHLDPKSHAPTVFRDNHGLEVDLWAVGKLISDAAVFASDIPVALVEFGEKMLQGHMQTAKQALQELEQVTAVSKHG